MTKQWVVLMLAGMLAFTALAAEAASKQDAENSQPMAAEVTPKHVVADGDGIIEPGEDEAEELAKQPRIRLPI